MSEQQEWTEVQVLQAIGAELKRQTDHLKAIRTSVAVLAVIALAGVIAGFVAAFS
jgi:hypothetical protein